MSDMQVDPIGDAESYRCEEEWVAPPPSTIAESIDVGRELRNFKKIADFKCGDQPRPAFRYPKPIGPWRKRKRKNGKSRRSYTCPFRIRLLARPLERHILLTLENYGHLLPARVVEAMRRSIGEEPVFTPKEAYGFFKQFHRKQKHDERLKRRQEKKLMPASRPCTKQHITFTRRASIMFARCLQRELIHPRVYHLTGSHILLSNVILYELCGYMKMWTPCRGDTRPKQQFIMEMADRITAWIDQILVDAGLRMLFVDQDEEEDISTDEDGEEEVDGEGDEDENYDDLLGDDQLPDEEESYQGDVPFQGNLPLQREPESGIITEEDNQIGNEKSDGQTTKQEGGGEEIGTKLASVLSVHEMMS